MKLIVALSAAVASAVFAVAAAADSAKPANPGGFGAATSTNARAGATGEFVRDLAVNNPPGTVAKDVEKAREALRSTPTPLGNPKSDR